MIALSVTFGIVWSRRMLCFNVFDVKHIAVYMFAFFELWRLAGMYGISLRGMPLWYSIPMALKDKLLLLTSSKCCSSSTLLCAKKAKGLISSSPPPMRTEVRLPMVHTKPEYRGRLLDEMEWQPKHSAVPGQRCTDCRLLRAGREVWRGPPVCTKLRQRKPKHNRQRTRP